MNKFKITDIDFLGRGITRIDNVVTFVANALKDETVEIEIIKKSKKYNEAKTISIENKSKDRIEPSCPYYQICGGCDLMHLNYEGQLNFKENKVKTTLQKFANLSPKIEKIIPADEIFNYRNKTTFQVNNDIGFFTKKSNDFVKIEKCLICDNNINILIEKLKKLDLQYVKSITVRVSKMTSEKMIIIEATNEIETKILDGLGSIYLKLNDKYIHKLGNQNITEKMNNYIFYISPSSFFQVNTLQAIKLYDKVKEYANLTGSENVLDLYCGTGTIGIYLAKNARKVYGIEINEDAINDANYNKKVNNIKNIEFYSLNANQFLEKINDKIDVLIVDPPRGGLDKKTINSVLKLNPKRIVYVSCDVATLARDLNILKENYDILKVTPVDMFPNTYHCESITVLERR